MSSKIAGIREMSNALEKMKKAAQELEGTHTVNFSEIFTSSFMSQHTNFSTFDEFLNAGKFIVDSSEDFEAIPDEDMDAHVIKSSKFSSWEEMLETATNKYIAKKLGL